MRFLRVVKSSLLIGAVWAVLGFLIMIPVMLLFTWSFARTLDGTSTLVFGDVVTVVFWGSVLVGGSVGVVGFLQGLLLASVGRLDRNGSPVRAMYLLTLVAAPLAVIALLAINGAFGGILIPSLMTLARNIGFVTAISLCLNAATVWIVGRGKAIESGATAKELPESQARLMGDASQ